MVAETSPHPAAYAGPDALVADVASRIDRARQAAADAGLDALVITPGTALRYLAGYDAIITERLTAFVLPVLGDPWLVAPALELDPARRSVAGGLGVPVRTWTETQDPVAILAADLRAAGVGAARGGAGPAGRIGVDDRMWTEKSLRLRVAAPHLEQVPAGIALDPLRMRKTAAEVDELAVAGAAIDRVHARMGEWLRVGRTERAVSADIGRAIVEEGHVHVDFAIVASGPNGGSPHHHVSDRVIEAGDAVVVDIGGVLESGYRSDCTRTYVVGDPHPEFLTLYGVLQTAQAAAVAAVRPGSRAGDLDATARDLITDGGYSELFTHRLGHGIGLDGHEPPWIVAGNALPVEEGFAFSVEPGIYDATRWGARVEDIVVVTATGVRPLNLGTHDLVCLPA